MRRARRADVRRLRSPRHRHRLSDSPYDRSQGSLEVERDGSLVRRQPFRVIAGATGANDWRLSLNPGWRLQAAERLGDFVLECEICDKKRWTGVACFGPHGRRSSYMTHPVVGSVSRADLSLIKAKRFYSKNASQPKPLRG